MNNQERRLLTDAVDREYRAGNLDRIMASLNSFSNWVKLTLHFLYLKIRQQMRKVWNWLASVFY
ncbi:hypothetical protein ABZ916_43475 [Streptomyces sp. NPDC046853]|uniref:hypothetical protein n=1 Tax=Streptomyces sp. NPDC046853 TaxID=3154920 RepID=UPI0033CECB67